MMKKNLWKAFAAVLLGMLLLTSAALGEARYPTQNGVLTDDVNAIGATVAKDVASYAEEVADACDVNLRVAVVSFLDGEEVQRYADTLFTRWALGDSDVLLLGAAGEDSFAIATGKDVKLSASSLNSLLYSSGFSDAFQAQQYDAAFAKFCLAFNAQIEKQYDERISVSKLFTDYQGSATPSATAKPETSAASDLWNDVMNSVSDSVTNYNTYSEQRHDESKGLSPTGWIVLVVIILIVFGQSEPARKSRHKTGCGCSPIGWLFGLLGISALFGRGGDRGPRFGRGPHRW